MPYALIALLAALVSTGWFLLATRAGFGSKVAVCVLCIASLAIGFFLPRWALASVLIQTSIVIGIRLYATATKARRDTLPK